MNYNIFISEEAHNDIDSVLDYIVRFFYGGQNYIDLI